MESKKNAKADKAIFNYLCSIANAIEMERVMLVGFQQNILKSLGK